MALHLFSAQPRPMLEKPIGLAAASTLLHTAPLPLGKHWQEPGGAHWVPLAVHTVG
jgi:hypothetical protein